MTMAYEPIPRPHVIGRRKGHLPPMIVLRPPTPPKPVTKQPKRRTRAQT